MKLDIDNITQGQVIKFKTINIHDNVLWQGKVEALCTYAFASKITDVDSIHQEVLRINNTLKPVTEQKFIVLAVTQSDGSVVNRAFALSWIDPSSCETVSDNTYFDFRVYDVDASVKNQILKTIRELGYSVSVLENS